MLPQKSPPQKPPQSPPPKDLSLWVQKASLRLQETNPALLKSLQNKNLYLASMAKSLSSLAEMQTKVLLQKGLSQEQAEWEAETLAMDTYLPAPGAET